MSRTLNFLGFGKKQPAAGDPPPDDEEEENKPAAEGDEDEPEAKDSKDKPDAEGDDEEAEDEDGKAETKAEKRARARERTRIGAIVTAAGPTRISSALSVALNTNLPTKQAVDMVKALSADDGGAGAKTPLDRAMEGRSPQLGTSGAPVGGKRRSLKDSMVAQLERRGMKGRS